MTAREMTLNGKVLALQSDQSLPPMLPDVVQRGGPLVLAPASITYVGFPAAAGCA